MVPDDPASASSKPGRDTTYRIVHPWSKDTQVGTVPSGQLKAKAGVRISVKNSSRL
eukprot:SAG31_NODE_598_length_13651_cov_10.681818_12_plen_56_part_00